MHREFVKDKFPVSHESYRKIVRQMNISFCKLGHELCEICTAHEEHAKTCTDKERYEDCRRFEQHRNDYTRAREEYRHDADREWEDGDVLPRT